VADSGNEVTTVRVEEEAAGVLTMNRLIHTAVAALLIGEVFWIACAAEPPPARELETLWADLSTKDPEKAEWAIASLVARPAQAVCFLGRRLRPVAAADARRVTQWLGDLDSEEFAEREAATRELAALGEVVEPCLEQALRSRPSAEVRQRIHGLLDKVKQDRLFPPPDQLRAARAVEVLERTGDDAVVRVLTTLAEGAPEASLTIAARSALERLSHTRAR
jgi:hypothetical protein